MLQRLYEEMLNKIEVACRKRNELILGYVHYKLTNLSLIPHTQPTCNHDQYVITEHFYDRNMETKAFKRLQNLQAI